MAAITTPWNVRSPHGKVHRTGQREDGSVRGMTTCGAAYVDFFATYEHGTMWPRTDEPLSCLNCIRITEAQA